MAHRALLVLAGTAMLSHARIHHLQIQNDPRYAFLIETFGFLNGGVIDLDIKDVSVSPANEQHTMGFVVVPVSTDDDASVYVESLMVQQICPLENPPEGSLMINISDSSTWKDLDEPADVNGDSIFALIFIHCSPTGSGVSVSFTLDATFANINGGVTNYLSAGEMWLPVLYGLFAMLFAGALVAWALYLRRHKSERARIHLGMSVLLGVKVLSLVSEAVMYHYIGVTGHNTAWNGMFYLFSILKGFLMVAVSLLVASGWSIMRPFLTDREKKVMRLALAMQLFANTAIIMSDELAPGSMQYTAWVWLLHVTDMAAAATVILPVQWSMKALEQSAAAEKEGDGAAKAAETLNRLQRFRNFYLYTLSYLYITRFLVWLLSTRVQYDQGWLPPLVDEACTLAYYLYTGYKFRPAGENAYLRVSGEDSDEGDIELGRATGAGMSGAGGSGAVQTVAATQRSAATAAVAEAGVASRGAALSVGADAALTKAAGANGRHVIQDDEDEFGLDEDLGSGMQGQGAVGRQAQAGGRIGGRAGTAAAASPVDDEGWGDAEFEEELDLDEEESKDLLAKGQRAGGTAALATSKPGGLKQVNKSKD